MPKKKAKPSGFSLFMFEFIRTQKEQHNAQYPKHKYSLVAAPHWEKLSPQDRERYNKRAKEQLSHAIQTNSRQKYTSQGQRISDVEQQQTKEENKQRFMQRKVKNMVKNAFLNGDIQTKPFYFIMANYFYKTNCNVFVPAELALLKFNFKDAILSEYYIYVNPQTVATGYAFEAKDHSERTHQLAPPPYAIGEKCYDAIYDKILDFLGIQGGVTSALRSSDDDRPSIFTPKDNVPMINSILSQLSYEHSDRVLDVFPFENLFYELKTAAVTFGVADEEPIPITVTNAFIEVDKYDFAPNIACQFHEDKDATKYCALSYVRRWFFLCCDHICEKLGLPLVPGKNLPSNADVNYRVEKIEKSDADDTNMSSLNNQGTQTNGKYFAIDASVNTPGCSGYSQLQESDDSFGSTDDDEVGGQWQTCKKTGRQPRYFGRPQR